MPSKASLLATIMVICLVLAVTGCIEQRDPPEEGRFTIDVHTEPMLLANAEDAVLHAPHAEVETELHHEHANYSWHIEGVGDYEGEEADIGPTPLAIRMATLGLEYYGQEMNLSLLVAFIGAIDESWAIIADGSSLTHGGEGSNHTDLEFEKVAGLEDIITPAVLIGPTAPGRMWIGEEIQETGMVFNVSLPWDAEDPTTYVFGFHLASPPTYHRGSDALEIFPGELHQLHYSGPGNLEITIANVSDPSQISFEGPFEELPSQYQTHVGTLVWEGDVGPEEEAPGMASWTALLAISLVVVMMGRRRDRRA